LSCSCEALVYFIKGQSERQPDFKPTRINMMLVGVQMLMRCSVISEPFVSYALLNESHGPKEINDLTTGGVDVMVPLAESDQ